MNYYFAVTIKVNELEELELLKTVAFENYGCQGLEEYSLNEAQVDNLLGEKSYGGGSPGEDVLNLIEESAGKDEFKFYFYGDEAEDASLKFKEYCSSFVPDYLNREKLEVKDWNQEWKNHYKKIVIENFLTIYPIWEWDKKSSEDIYINPGMAFGTGDHETTQLCLEFLKDFKEKIIGSNVLDFGCGSGILGIAAAKKGASFVTYYDVEDEALENCVENVNLNIGAKGIFKVSKDPSDISKGKYQIVLANILLNILKMEVGKIKNAVSKNGIIIISGVLKDQANEIETFYCQQFNVKSVFRKFKNDWASLAFILND